MRLSSVSRFLAVIALTLVMFGPSAGATLRLTDSAAARLSRAALSPSWHDALRQFLRDLILAGGGNPDAWDSNTLNDYPMNMVQDVYVQMGGNPASLDVSSCPKEEQESAFHAVFLAVGGKDEDGSLTPMSLDDRADLLWFYLESLGPTSE